MKENQKKGIPNPESPLLGDYPGTFQRASRQRGEVKVTDEAGNGRRGPQSLEEGQEPRRARLEPEKELPLLQDQREAGKGIGAGGRGWGRDT